MNPVYWGPSPEVWNPDRWDNLPEAYKTASMPGPSGLPAFSNGPASWSVHLNRRNANLCTDLLFLLAASGLGLLSSK